MKNPVQDGMPGWLKGIDLNDLAEMIEERKIDPIYRDYVIYVYIHHSKSSEGLEVWPKKHSTPENPFSRVRRGRDWSDGDDNDIFGELFIKSALRFAQMDSGGKRNGFRVVRNKS